MKCFWLEGEAVATLQVRVWLTSVATLGLTLTSEKIGDYTMSTAGSDPARDPGSGVLVRLTYVSRSTAALSSAALSAILEQARVNNLPRGITGTLCFNSDLFLQSIEGSRPIINRLYNKLLVDPRHTSVQLLELVEINERQWADWSMGYAVPSADNRAVFLKYSAMAQFQPYTMRARAVLKLLEDLQLRALAEQKAAIVPAPAAPAGIFDRLRVGKARKAGV